MLEVGKKIFLKAVGNRARGGNKEIKEVVILKIGKKYFYVGDEGKEVTKRPLKFNIENLSQVTDYSADWKLYFSKQEILDENEKNELEREIRMKFKDLWNCDFSIDQLRRIKSIIDEQ